LDVTAVSVQWHAGCAPLHGICGPCAGNWQGRGGGLPAGIKAASRPMFPAQWRRSTGLTCP